MTTFLQRLEALNPEQFISDLRTDIAEAKADLAAAQAEITTLTNGYLTVTTEIQLLREALTTAGITLSASVIPTPAPSPNPVPATRV